MIEIPLRSSQIFQLYGYNFLIRLLTTNIETASLIFLSTWVIIMEIFFLLTLIPQLPGHFLKTINAACMLSTILGIQSKETNDKSRQKRTVCLNTD